MIKSKYFIIFFVIGVGVAGIYLVINHFKKKDSMLFGGTILIVIALIAALGYFYHPKYIHYTSSVDINDSKLNCACDDTSCKIDTKEHRIYYSYFYEDDDKNKSLICQYENERKRIKLDEELQLDNIFFTINNLKVSQDSKDFNTSFNLQSLITNKMIDFDKTLGAIKVSICEKPCTAHLMPDSTYSTHQKWTDVEKIIRINCDKNISIKRIDDLSDNGRNFNIVLPPGDVKNVKMRENRYVFTGENKQSQFPIFFDENNSEALINVRILQKTACFVLSVDDNNTFKIENGVASLNQEKINDSIILKDVDEVSLTVQKKASGIVIRAQSHGDIFAQTLIRTAQKNKFFIGYVIKSRVKKDVLSVAVEIQKIR